LNGKIKITNGMFELNKFEIISKYYDLFHIASGLKAKDARE
jgi:hypothetical protein